MSEEDEKILRYGQVILLHYFDDENGFISADGHVKKHVQMRSYDKKYISQKRSKNQNKINKDDFSNCLYQIFPKVVNTQKTKIVKDIEAYKKQKLRDEDQNELTKEKLEMLKYGQPSEKQLVDVKGGKKEDKGKAVPQLEAEEDDKDQFLKRISKHQITLQNEFKYNVDTFENNKNLPVSYNQPFQLLHINSSKFLSCNFVESTHEKENYEISLEEYSQDSTLFKIVPAFKYQKDSSAVIGEGDCIWIIRALPFNNKTIHLHCSVELNEMKKRSLHQKLMVNATFQNTSQLMADQHPHTNNNNNNNNNNLNNDKMKQQPKDSDIKMVSSNKIQKREINGCLEQATTLKFKIYQEITDARSKYLNCGDAIWLHHSEANSSLSVIRKERGTTRYTFTSLNIDENLEIFVPQTKQSQSFEDYSGNTFGLWIIENVDFKKGGHVEYGVGYRLKHMPTGYYLTVIDENVLIIDQKLKDLEKQNQELLKNKKSKNTTQINKSRYDDLSEKSDEDEDDEDNHRHHKKEKDQVDERSIDQINEGEASDQDDIDDALSGGDETSPRKNSSRSKNNQKQKTKKKKVNKEEELFNQKRKMNNKWKLSLTMNGSDPFTLFQFFALGTSPSIYEQNIEPGNFIFIRNIESKQWLDVVNLLNSKQQDNVDIPSQMKNFQNLNQLSAFDQNESTSAFSPLRATLKSEQAENQVFKVFQVSSNEVWEAKFVISCSNVLLKFLINQKRLNTLCEQGDEISIRTAKAKIKISRECIKNLNNFCSNKLLNYQQEQKFGTPNSRRQKLLREQYYIDFLVKILEDLLPKKELEVWTEYKIIMEKEKKEKEEEQQEDSSGESEDEEQKQNAGKFKIQGLNLKKKKRSSKFKNGKISKLSANKDHALYLKEKVDMAKDIYELLATLCKNNGTNEEYTFKLIPFFQIHCKYLPEAIDCLINLTSNNENILLALSENLKVDFDYEKREESHAIESRSVKILINLYDQDNNNRYDDGDKIAFRQHEKITTKPINLILYFMNLIWEENSRQKSNYLKFLRSICRHQNKGISLNQENIFKIYKKYSKQRNAIRYDQYFKSGSIKLPEHGKDLKQFENDVSEQLRFYSELSFGRNFLWRKELIPHFSNYYLLQNIWSQGDLKEYPVLRSCFCQLAMSLYIDHEPLQRSSIPNYCRLFELVGEEKHEKVFDEENNQENEIVMYKNLLNGLETYLRNISSSIQDLTKFYKIKDKTEREVKFKITKRSQSILQDPLLLNSMELIHLLIELNLYGSLSKTHSYKDFMPYLLNILIYDLKNLEYFTACACTFQEQNEERKEKKKKRNSDLLNLGFASGLSAMKNVANSLNKAVAGGGQNEEGSDEIDYELDSQDLVNPLEQSKQYDNHIMRGQIKLHNQLEEMNFSDSIGYQTEIKVKLKVLDVLEHFMDLRHNYLMTNVLKFFKDNIAGAIKDSDPVKAKKLILKIVKDHIKGFLPNIPLTGIESVDKLFEPKESSFKLDFNIKNLTNLNKSKNKEHPQEKFHCYIKKENYIHYEDFNNLLSAAIEGVDEYEDPIATSLPSLLSSFLIIYDENLEKRLLKILIRMYNQRYDLLENISKLQIIFDKQTQDLFKSLEDMQGKLNKYVEQCEMWFTTFATNKYEEHSISFLIDLLDNLNNGFFKCMATSDGQIILLEQSKKREFQKVDKEKQKIYQYLKIYEPILQLLKEGMHHFDQYILLNTYPTDKKHYLIKLFELVYEFLIYFTSDEKENQAIIKKHIPLICQYLKYDLGQTKLISSIYKDNIDLLINIDKSLVDTFLELIETEGRQIHFLDIFETILKIRSKYIFDNQLLILNTFLPQKSFQLKPIFLKCLASFRRFLNDHVS